MNLTTAIQECLLAILCYDKSARGAKVVEAMLPWKIYDVYYREVAKGASEYLHKYHKPPGSHTLDIFNTLKAQNPNDADVYERLYRSLQGTRKSINHEYVMGQAALFSRQQGLKVALGEVISLVEKGDEESLNRVSAIMKKAERQSFDAFHPGIRLTDASQSLRFLDAEGDTFPMGIKEFDQFGIAPARKELLIYQALYGKGKTWAMCHSARHAMMGGRANVAWASCEMSEAKVAQRFIQSLFRIAKRPSEDSHYVKFRSDEAGHVVGFKHKPVMPRGHFSDPKIRRYLEKQLALLAERAPRLYIRQFPSGSLTISQLEAWLDALEGAEGFIPDMVIVDYLDIMKVDPKFQTEEVNKLTVDFRGLAISRNFAGVTAAQGNRGAEGAKTQTGKEVAGAFGRYGTADVVVTYNQSIAEKELGLARLFAAKGRNDRDRFTVMISQAYEVGQFCIASMLMKKKQHYWDLVKQETGETDEADAD